MSAIAYSQGLGPPLLSRNCLHTAGGWRIIL
nr:MAG TPA: hypothetical protein [Caudoviricetes sp.]